MTEDTDTEQATEQKVIDLTDEFVIDLTRMDLREPEPERLKVLLAYDPFYDAQNPTLR